MRISVYDCRYRAYIYIFGKYLMFDFWKQLTKRQEGKINNTKNILYFFLLVRNNRIRLNKIL